MLKELLKEYSAGLKTFRPCFFYNESVIQEGNMMKKKIAVLFGGVSGEYEVSLQSAAAVITNIPDTYEVLMIGIDRHSGAWYLHTGTAEEIRNDTWRSHASVQLYPALDRDHPGFVCLENGEKKILHADAAFPVLHGKNGEDGTVQGTLELSGIRLIGCGVLSSALGMDKVRADLLVGAAGIPTARHVVLKEESELQGHSAEIAALGFPLFVKPVRSGSSLGITCVRETARLAEAVHSAFAYDSTVIIEEYIGGTEIGCAVMGEKELITGEPDQIVLQDGFFDFTEKYTLKTSEIIVPAPVSEERKKEIREKAALIYRLLGCSGFARVDFFLRKDGTLFFNEINTIPGFTLHSRFPGMMQAAGMSFPDVIRFLLEGGR